MLVLSFKPGERVLVPQSGLVITYCRSKQGEIKLGFEAPAGLNIYRERVLEELQRQGLVDDQGVRIEQTGAA